MSSASGLSELLLTGCSLAGWITGGPIASGESMGRWVRYCSPSARRLLVSCWHNTKNVCDRRCNPRIRMKPRSTPTRRAVSFTAAALCGW